MYLKSKYMVTLMDVVNANSVKSLIVMFTTLNNQS
jgi:hypothetical protein